MGTQQNTVECASGQLARGSAESVRAELAAIVADLEGVLGRLDALQLNAAAGHVSFGLDLVRQNLQIGGIQSR